MPLEGKSSERRSLKSRARAALYEVVYGLSTMIEVCFFKSVLLTNVPGVKKRKAAILMSLWLLKDPPIRFPSSHPAANLLVRYDITL